MTVQPIDISPDTDAHVVGRIGENLASYYLEASGFECSIVDRRGSDIWCKYNSHLFTVEVKAGMKATVSSVNKDGTPALYYNFCIRKKEADQFFLICLDTNLVRVLSKEKLIERIGPKRHMLHMRPDEFTPEFMAADMRRLKSYYSL